MGTSEGDRTWVADPEVSDDSVREATGNCWDQWCDEIEAWPGHSDGHAAIAAWLHAHHGLDLWWSQTVTVGYERIAGTRLPHEMPDGTFTANKSRTFDDDLSHLRAQLLTEDGRRVLFPGLATALTSKPDAKTIRFDIGPGSAKMSIDHSDGRTRIAVQHAQLPALSDVDESKQFWAEWFDTLT